MLYTHNIYHTPALVYIHIVNNMYHTIQVYYSTVTAYLQ